MDSRNGAINWNYLHDCPMKEVSIEKDGAEERVALCKEGNAYYRSKLDELDKVRQSAEWEWLENCGYADGAPSDKYELIETEYPVRAKYYVNRKYPNYAFNGETVFTKEGELIRSDNLYRDSWEMDNVIREIEHQLCVRDYQENKYDIKSKPAKTQKYIQNELGMINTTGQVINDLVKIGNSERQAERAITRSQYVKAKQNSMSQVLALLINYIDADGKAYVKQLHLDHEDECRTEKIYRIYRVSDVSLKVYLWKDAPKIITAAVIVTYVNDAPFSCRVGSVELVE